MNNNFIKIISLNKTRVECRINYNKFKENRGKVIMMKQTLNCRVFRAYQVSKPVKINNQYVFSFKTQTSKLNRKIKIL